MAVAGDIFIVESELWPQRDARDPLGIFGWRGALAGDVSGGSIKATINVAEAIRHAYVLKIYDMHVALVVGTPATVGGKMRILTNWPNIDLQAGIQAYAAFYLGVISGTTVLDPPDQGFTDQNPFNGNSKELLIYDPSTRDGDMAIAEQEVTNTDGLTYSFEGYGYYWDRAVMNTPGGPRNPGTS